MEKEYKLDNFVQMFEREDFEQQLELEIGAEVGAEVGAG